MKQLIYVCILATTGYLLSDGTLHGQSKEELKRKFGEPLSEVFMVRPGVTVTATYATDGRIVEMLISPRTAGMTKSRGATLSQDTVRAILDELVPDSVRGKHLISGFLTVVCDPENDCAGSYAQFQNVTIYYNAGSAGGLCYAVVQWRK